MTIRVQLLKGHAKGQRTATYLNGTRTGWTDYRYGLPAAHREKSRPIYNPAVEKRMTGDVANIFREFAFTPFEHEASCRHGIRAALCADGYAWQRSDDQAAAIVAGALEKVGAKRPTWLEGQPGYTIALENCVQCGGEIDDADNTRKQRFCSTECAKAYISRQANKHLAEGNAMLQSAYALVWRKSHPPRPCAHCGTLFQSAGRHTRHCSDSCAATARMAARGLALSDRSCPHCQATFMPKTGGQIYCSRSCSKRGSIAIKAASLPDRICTICGSVFHPTAPHGVYCSDGCKKSAERIFEKLRLGRMRTLTPTVFDFSMRYAGVPLAA